ncbi:sigma-70 family RNA polymerase sigma factor [Orrella sp. JC864]|uniref:RNA polymerase sigma factor n=1 Tax=Orrella sp. JC864 TaxID=3120298 RepID=UPI003008584F
MDMSVSFCHAAPAQEGYAGPAARGEAAGGVLRDYLAAHYGTLHRRLAHDLGCPDLASDCLHDAWLRLGGPDLPSPVLRPGAYVYRMARNLALDRLRSESRLLPLEAMDCESQSCDPLPRPDEAAAARSELARLDRALHGLPFRHRCVLFELRVEERTRAQVARTYGVSVRGVDALLRQTLAHCAEAMALK